MPELTTVSPDELTISANLLEDDEMVIVSGGLLKRLPKSAVSGSELIDWDLSATDTVDAKHSEAYIELVPTDYIKVDDDTFKGDVEDSTAVAYARLGSPLPDTGKVFFIHGANFTTGDFISGGSTVIIGDATGPVAAIGLQSDTNKLHDLINEIDYADDWDGESLILIELDLDAGNISVKYNNLSSTVVTKSVDEGLPLAGKVIRASMDWSDSTPVPPENCVTLSVNTALLAGGLSPTSGYMPVQQNLPVDIPTEAKDGDILKVVNGGERDGTYYHANDLFMIVDSTNRIVRPFASGTPGKRTYVGSNKIHVPTDFSNINDAVTFLDNTEVISGDITIVIESGYVCTMADSFDIREKDYSHVNLIAEDDVVDWDLSGADYSSGLWSLYSSKFGNLSGHYRKIAGGETHGLLDITETTTRNIGAGPDRELTVENFEYNPTISDVSAFFLYLKVIMASDNTINSSLKLQNNNYLMGSIKTNHNVSAKGFVTGVILNGDGSYCQVISCEDEAQVWVRLDVDAWTRVRFNSVPSQYHGKVSNYSANVTLDNSTFNPDGVYRVGSAWYNAVEDKSEGGFKSVKFEGNWDWHSSNIAVASEVGTFTNMHIHGDVPQSSIDSITRAVSKAGAGSRTVIDSGFVPEAVAIRDDADVGNAEFHRDGSFVHVIDRTFSGPLSNIHDVVANTDGYPNHNDSVVVAIKKLSARVQENAQQATYVSSADNTDLTTLASSIDAIRDALIAAGIMSDN